jgi:Na+-transporting methylmalonyl-CoA/oxaloacetate decarboxylase gamma subunit
MSISIIAAIPPPPQGALEVLRYYLPFQGVGLAVVLVTLTVLCAICVVFGRFFRRFAVPRPSAHVVAVPAAGISAAPIASAAVTEPGVVAAIAAAIAVTLDQPHRIIEIHGAESAPGLASAWAIEGRFQHFSSHKLR